MQSGVSQPKFRKNISSLLSGTKFQLSKKPAEIFLPPDYIGFLVSLLFNLKMDVVRSSETPAEFHLTIRTYIPERRTLRSQTVRTSNLLILCRRQMRGIELHNAYTPCFSLRLLTHMLGKLQHESGIKDCTVHCIWKEEMQRKINNLNIPKENASIYYRQNGLHNLKHLEYRVFEGITLHT
jgi:hypothetical protein